MQSSDRPQVNVAELDAKHRRLRGIINRAHGALVDCSDIPVPCSVEEDIAPAIAMLRGQRDEARRLIASMRDAFCIIRDIAARPQVVELARRFAEERP